MQITGWDTQARSRYESYRSLFSCAAYTQCARIISKWGTIRALQLSMGITPLNVVFRQAWS